jgi:uncharacterized protein YndB with AHSA1/START domain
MAPDRERPTGLSKDAGWEIGVSKTVAVDRERTWAFLTSDEGVALWLGPGAEIKGPRGTPYRTDQGITGEIRSFRPLDRVRLTWRPPGWDHDSTLQVAVTGGRRTSIRFHQERMASKDEREEMRDHWRSVLTKIEQALQA